MKKVFKIIFICCIINILFNLNCNNVLADEYNRISGLDRYLTSVEVSKYGWESSNIVVIATGSDYPDALCAAPLAKKYDAPILLNNKDYLNENVKQEILRLKPKKIYIIGGKGVISSSVEDELKKMDIECERISGKDRYETSINIAKKLDMSSKIILATGSNFADSLSIAPIAAIEQIPILLCNQSGTNDYIKEYLKDKHIDKTYIIGGPSIINSSSEKIYPNAERIYGKDRYETNIKIIEKFSEDINKYKDLYIACGYDFPDALSGSALCSKNSSFIVLTSKQPQECTYNFVKEQYNMNININIIGGEGVIPHNVIEKLLYGEIYSINSERTFEIKQVLTIANNSEDNITNIYLKDSIGYLNGSPYQTNETLSASGQGLKIETNKYNEKEARIYLPELKIGQSRTYIIKRKFKQGTLEYNVNLENNSGNYDKFEDYVKYTSPEDKIESDNILIINKAKEIVGDETNPYIKAKKIYAYVNTSLDYDYTEGNKGALNALITKKGICEDYSDLFVALCRAVGVPARVVSGYWVDTRDLTKTLCIDSYAHAWVEFYLPEYGWIIAEPTISYYINGKKVLLYNNFAQLPEVGHFISGYTGDIGFTCSWNGYGSLDITRKVYVTDITD